MNDVSDQRLAHALPGAFVNVGQPGSG